VGLCMLFSATRVKARDITDIQMFAGMRILGSVGSTQIVQYATSLSTSANWTILASVVLTNSSQFFLDLTSPNAPQRFYRSAPAESMGFCTVTLLNINDTSFTNASPRGTNRSIIFSPGRLGRLTNAFTVPTASIYATGDLYFDVPYMGGGAGAYVVLGDTNSGSLEIANVISSTHLVVRLHHGTAVLGTVYSAGTNVRQDGSISDTEVTRLVNTFRAPAKGATITDVLVTSLATPYLNAYVYIDGYAYQITAAAPAGPPPVLNQ